MEISNCSNCEAELAEGVNFCSNCGTKKIGKSAAQEGSTNDDVPADAVTGQGDGCVGLIILSFFLPIIGLVLYLVWNEQHQHKAKPCGKAALFGFIVGIIISIAAFGATNKVIKDQEKVMQKITRDAEIYQRHLMQQQRDVERHLQQQQRELDRELKRYNF